MIEKAMGASLDVLRKVASSELIDQLGLRKQTEKVIHEGAKAGFATVIEANKRFNAKSKPMSAERLERPEQRGLFDLTPTEEQEMICEMLGRFAVDVLRPAAEEADTAQKPPADLLSQLAELGITAMAIPEAYGGAGFERSVVTGALMAEQLAYGDAALAVAALAPLAVVHSIVAWGTAEQQAKFLPPFASEAPPAAALALFEKTPFFDPFALKTRAVARGGSYVIDGVKEFVPLAEDADLLLVAANTPRTGPQLFLIERGTEGVTVEPSPAMGLRGAGLCRVSFKQVKVPDSARLGQGVTNVDYEELVNHGRIGWAAIAVGCGRAVLDYTKEYCNERVAFGEPITNRQAVAFMIADIAIELEGTRLMLLRAASRADAGKAFTREAYLSRLQASIKGMKIGTDGVQLLGGAGYIKEHPIERWYRHLRAVGVIQGNFTA